MPQKKKLPLVTVGICSCECSCLCDSGNPWKYGELGVHGKNGCGLAAICEAGGEYWRLFTATFMHFGFEHIFK